MHLRPVSPFIPETLLSTDRSTGVLWRVYFQDYLFPCILFRGITIQPGAPVKNLSAQSMVPHLTHLIIMTVGLAIILPVLTLRLFKVHVLALRVKI